MSALLERLAKKIIALSIIFLKFVIDRVIKKFPFLYAIQRFIFVPKTLHHWTRH